MLPLIATKRPGLDVISSYSLEQAAARKLQWVISTAVLHHVSPSELGEFFSNLSLLVQSGAVCLISFKPHDEIERLSDKSWAYTFTHLRWLASCHGMIAEEMPKADWSKHSLFSLRIADSLSGLGSKANTPRNVDALGCSRAVTVNAW
jgi:hypothetical protein